MDERFLEANGLNNDDDFPRTTDHGEPKETWTESNEPPRSTRSNPVEAMCKWTGADPSDCAKERTSSTVNFKIELHQHYREKRGCREPLMGHPLMGLAKCYSHHGRRMEWIRNLYCKSREGTNP